MYTGGFSNAQLDHSNLKTHHKSKKRLHVSCLGTVNVTTRAPPSADLGAFTLSRRHGCLQQGTSDAVPISIPSPQSDRISKARPSVVINESKSNLTKTDSLRSSVSKNRLKNQGKDYSKKTKSLISNHACI